MDRNPYAPPKSAIADPPASPAALKRISVWLMIGLAIITFGLYYTVWFFRRRNALNQLSSPRKLQLWPLLCLVAFLVVDFVVAIAAGNGPPEAVIGMMGVLTLTLARLVIGILMIVQCFIIKDILEDHLAGPSDGSVRELFVDRVRLSGLLTFFFSIFYLQYIINKHIVVTREPYPAG